MIQNPILRESDQKGNLYFILELIPLKFIRTKIHLTFKERLSLKQCQMEIRLFYYHRW